MELQDLYIYNLCREAVLFLKNIMWEGSFFSVLKRSVLCREVVSIDIINRGGGGVGQIMKCIYI